METMVIRETGEVENGRDALEFYGFGASAHLAHQVAWCEFPATSRFVFTGSKEKHDLARTLGGGLEPIARLRTSAAHGHSYRHPLRNTDCAGLMMPWLISSQAADGRRKL